MMIPEERGTLINYYWLFLVERVFFSRYYNWFWNLLIKSKVLARRCLGKVTLWARLLWSCYILFLILCVYLFLLQYKCILLSYLRSLLWCYMFSYMEFLLIWQSIHEIASVKIGFWIKKFLFRLCIQTFPLGWKVPFWFSPICLITGQPYIV